MKEIVTPFKVGLLVIIALGAFFWMFGRIEEGIGNDPSGYRVYAIFKDVGGLAEKSRVTIAGINVGQIDKIELDGHNARVWLRVNTPLRDDARIAKRQASLLGEYFLQLTPGYTGKVLRDGDEIRNIDYDVAPADLINDLKAITKNVTSITESIKRVVSSESGEERLVAILENINRTVADVADAVKRSGPKVDRVVDNVVKVTDDARRFTDEFRRDARQILTDARAVAANVREIVGENSGNVSEGFEGVKGAVNRLQSSLDKLETTLGHAENIARKVDEGQGTIGKLINDDRLVNNVNDLVEESGQFIKQITRLQTIVAMRSDYYFGRGDVRNAAELRLQPRPDKYYMLQLVDDPRGRTEVVRKVVNTDGTVENQTIQSTEDRFRLSLEFAKRIYFATGRIGIIENTGGLGLDLHFFDDQLEISADLFAFDAAEHPRLRLSALYMFFTHLYIAAGVDEVFNEDLTDGFIGVGIRFNDEDLKAILTTAPTPSL
ncbi:MAG: MCE family protein [Myxococcales bacterium]|nr:MCE family protein [Myxococcales bacterium]